MTPGIVANSRLTRWICALIVITGLYGVLRVGTQGTPAPILLVVNTDASNTNRFGPYLGEILKSEGLNYFSRAELSAVTSTTLNDAQIVILAETELSATEALLFTNFANAGGRLIVMRPD